MNKDNEMDRNNNNMNMLEQYKQREEQLVKDVE